MLKRSGNSTCGIGGSEGLGVAGEGAAGGAVRGVEVRARLPEFGEEPLVGRGLQVADALGAARALLGAEHPLAHLDVVVAPEREVFVVRDERFGELELLVA